MEGVLVVAAVLACPVGMGLMMLFMGKGMFGSKRRESAPPDRAVTLAELESEQARLHEQIERLEEPRPDGRAPAPTARS